MERVGSAESFADQPPPLGRAPRTIEEVRLADHRDYLEHPSYDRYMRMHKVFVGRGGSEELEQIHDNLKDEIAPRFLIAAGWAAVEIALVRRDMQVNRRLALLQDARDIWHMAVDNHNILEPTMLPDKAEYGQRSRAELDIAVLPLLKGIVEGDVTRKACHEVFTECLGIGKQNNKDLAKMVKERNNAGIAEYVGFGYENNALLAFNRMHSRTWFAIPSMARSDSGYHHRKQSHDLLILHQNYGEIVRSTPVEIKAKASLRDRLRYDALLVRGKMHLSVEGKARPQHTLNAIDAVYRGGASAEEQRIADNATERLVNMVRDYYAGEKLGKLAAWHTVTMFQDNSQVVAKHPGLSRVSA
jgi:hypothetical protein